jgi:hypothetical protein
VVPNPKQEILPVALPFVLRSMPRLLHIRHSQGWINEVIEDIDELVKEWLWRKPTKKSYRLPTWEMWLTFGKI